MNKKEIIIMVGNIGSGKSTLAKKYVKKGYSVISRDAFRYMIGAGKYIFDIKLEPIIKKSTQLMLKTFMKNEIPIVYDETNVSKKLRASTIKIAKKYNYKITVIELPSLSKKISVNRRMKNPHGNYDRKIWNMVWNNFNNIYESPSKKEGIDKVIKL